MDKLWLSAQETTITGMKSTNRKNVEGTICYSYSCLCIDRLTETLERSSQGHIRTRIWLECLVPGLCQSLAQMFRLWPRIAYSIHCSRVWLFSVLSEVFSLHWGFFCTVKHFLKWTQTRQKVPLQHFWLRFLGPLFWGLWGDLVLYCTIHMCMSASG